MALMNLRHIEVFHAVYVAGTVSGAARALQVSQPSVSKVLRHAESRVGFKLFDVIKGRLVPTEEAHILFHEAREVNSRVESLDETARNLGRGSEGHLRLAALHSLGLDAVPMAVARFRQEHPEVSFDIKTLHSEDISRALCERACDLAIAYDARHHPRLTHKTIGAGELVMLFHKEDLPDPPDRVSVAMMGDRDLIRLVNAGSVGTLFNKIINRDAAGPNILVQTYFVAAALVRRRAGFAIVDEYTALALRTSELDYRPLVDKVEFEVFGVSLEERSLSRLERKFLATMEATLTEVRA
ncbi:LysR family transcriptional regulator [Sphingosinicella rhizophila]|uniref:LysR substrate-binding domain-containing protein n=1 Tax=Sphingosinicella rhizophila TaxID=3050082 RepID=A0ABU3Q8K5_9SPHN|nr:LysR substrate-binding domain-containing protein [Sphingosinicella sp. GR2756]MDT9599716.1 LysR substrate-binding domain-containing protein [Sphingosinicella sp. GR2756]